MINFVIFSQISVALIIFLLDVGRIFLGIRIGITVWGTFLHILASSHFTALVFCVFVWTFFRRLKVNTTDTDF